MCKELYYKLADNYEIIPYTWYALEARNLLNEKNVFGSVSANINELPNIVYESVLILQDYDNELKNEKIKAAQNG